MAVRGTAHEHGLYRDSILPVRSRIRVRYTQRSLLLFRIFCHSVLFFCILSPSLGANILEILNGNYDPIPLCLSLFFLYRLICVCELMFLFSILYQGIENKCFFCTIRTFLSRYAQMCNSSHHLKRGENSCYIC